MGKLIDVFNGDADGLCALQQLYLAAPHRAERVTGIKRDIALLARVDAGQGDEVTVLDVSLAANRADVLRLLEAGARIRYFDHHFAGEPLSHPAFEGHIDTAPDVCTSLLVDRHLAGRHRLWAAVGAFGDNLDALGRSLCAALELPQEEVGRLAELGRCLNYNGYGEAPEDLHFHPAALFDEIHPYADPRRFCEESKAFAKLRAGYGEDLALAERLSPALAGADYAAYILPDAPWARRVSGELANRLASSFPARAHAVLTPNSQGGYIVSVRAPKLRPGGADELCLSFPTGGGRKAAAGINHLPRSELAAFSEAFAARFRLPS